MEQKRTVINQKTQLMSDSKQLLPDWMTGPEGGAVTCEDVTFKFSTSRPILDSGGMFNCDMRSMGE